MGPDERDTGELCVSLQGALRAVQVCAVMFLDLIEGRVNDPYRYTALNPTTGIATQLLRKEPRFIDYMEDTA